LLGKFELSGIPPAPRGVPQIEVSFDVDANGILGVSASDKSSGKTEKITIKNEKGRLSQEEIEKMVADAEKFAAEDAEVVKRTAAKNGLESYVYSLKATLSEQGDKLGSDKATLQEKVDEVIKFLEESSESASITEIEERKTELEGIANPIMVSFTRDNRPECSH
jgi:heat shock protein 1/8